MAEFLESYQDFPSLQCLLTNEYISDTSNSRMSMAGGGVPPVGTGVVGAAGLPTGSHPGSFRTTILSSCGYRYRCCVRNTFHNCTQIYLHGFFGFFNNILKDG